MGKRAEICRDIIDHVHPDTLQQADKLLSKLLRTCPKASDDGVENMTISVDPDALRLIATYASFGRRPFLDAMSETLED